MGSGTFPYNCNSALTARFLRCKFKVHISAEIRKSICAFLRELSDGKLIH